ncbi:DUF3667 domain-containing protein [Litoribaculum gwangyangense]|uniref:DUF3667 domain-containing protein n=1 Tax=Litoribaculum gwangyangense TaxID=1130722 RepID=A0ABP9CXU0_9FLAO
MHCKNCDTNLIPESEYCHTCGGKIIRKRLTIKNLFEHISETFFNYDNKLLRTFIDLFIKPELVINSYISGVRKRYVNPLSFFGVSLTLSGLAVFVIKKFYVKYFDFSSMFSSQIYNNDISKQLMENSTNSAFEYSSLIYSAMVPFMAMISIIVFYNKRYNLTEHVIIYLYSMSALSIVSVILGQIVLFLIPEKYMLFTITFYFIMFFYHAYILKRIFKLSPAQLILKILFFLVVFLAMYIVFSILMAIFMILTGAINFENFKPEAS